MLKGRHIFQSQSSIIKHNDNPLGEGLCTENYEPLHMHSIFFVPKKCKHNGAANFEQLCNPTQQLCRTISKVTNKK